MIGVQDSMNKELFAKLFKVGEVIDSGSPPEFANHARLKILSIEEDFVYYKSLKSKTKNHFRYSYIDVVLEGFDRIDPNSIQPSIQHVFLDAGLQKNYSTENYVYGFAKEIRRRLGQSEPAMTSSGEVLEDQDQVAKAETGRPLSEGAILRVLVDRRERNPEAVRLCKALHGVQCLCCGFDFEKFYGSLGAGFIHAHHLSPISGSGGIYQVDPKNDLVPLCPNCHAMIHRGEKLLTIAELKELIANAHERSMSRKDSEKFKAT